MHRTTARRFGLIATVFLGLAFSPGAFAAGSLTFSGFVKYTTGSPGALISTQEDIVLTLTSDGTWSATTDWSSFTLAGGNYSYTYSFSGSFDYSGTFGENMDAWDTSASAVTDKRFIFDVIDGEVVQGTWKEGNGIGLYIWDGADCDYRPLAAQSYSISADTCQFSVVGAQPPSAPAAPTASDGAFADRVELTWAVVADAGWYDVYHCPSGSETGCTKIGDTAASAYADYAALAGEVYYYRISACNSAGCSPLSAEDAGFIERHDPAGDILYGTIKRGGDLSTLVRVDPDTGAITEIGPIGYSVNGLEYDYTTDTLFATTSQNDPDYPVGLIRVDTSSGTGAPVAAMPPIDDTIVALTSDSGGNLYGWIESGEDDLATINKVTGATARVGESRLSTSRHGLAFDRANRLLLVNGGGEVFQIDPASGGSTSLGTLSTAHHGDFGPENLYWGVSNNADSILVLDLDAMTLERDIPVDESAELHTLSWAAGEPGGCDLDVGAWFEGGSMVIDFHIASEAPSFWSVSLFLLGVQVPIVESIALPAMDPPLDAPIPVPLPPNLGNVAVTSFLWTLEEGVICASSATAIDEPRVLAPAD